MHTYHGPLPYFPLDELACSCCGSVALDIRAAARLPALRIDWAKPIALTSACRCAAHNEAEGGHPRSLHLIDNPVWPTRGCMGFDVKWRQWTTTDKLAFARLAWRRGWSIGLHDGFCHIDGRLWLNCGLKQRVYQYKAWAGWFRGKEIKAD